MLRPRLAIALLLTISTATAVSADSPAQAGVLDEWQPLEQMATTPETRAALSREMLNALPRIKARHDKLQLAQRAYELGAQDPQGYRWAAKALEQIQRADPSRRLWCLEQLVEMYTQACRSHAAESKYAVALSDVLGQLVDQRLLNIDSAIEAGRIDPDHAVEQLDLALREAQLAGGTLKRAASLARTESRRIKSRQPSGADDLLGLAASLDTQSNDNRDLQRQVGQRKHVWTQLLDAQQRFAASSSADDARKLAMIYITEFDRPALMPLPARDSLDDQTERHIAQACRPVSQLSAAEAMELAKWYDQLSRGSDAESRADMLIRTRLYFQRASEAGDGMAKIVIIRVDQDLERAGIYPAAANRLTRELAARLDFLFGPRPAAPGSAAAATPAGASAHAGFDNAAAPAQTTTQFGRPMVTCDQCGRLFFPGWGQTASTCPLCRSGHKNIFDFANGNGEASHPGD